MATKKITAKPKPVRPSVSALRQKIAELEKECLRLVNAYAASERELQLQKRISEKHYTDLDALKNRVAESRLFAGPGKLLDTTMFPTGELVTLVRAASALGHICVIRAVENKDDRSPHSVRLELMAHENHLPPTIGFR